MTPFAVYGLIAANLFTFIYEGSLAVGDARDAFITAYALVPYDLTHGVQLAGSVPPTALTLVTSQFLHGSVFHLVLNIVFFAVFGPNIEWLTGSLRFVLFYIVCGVLGGLAQVSSGSSSHVPEIGASGAIAGVLGAYIVRFPTHRVMLLPAFIVIGLWAGAQFVHGFGPLSGHVPSEQRGGVAYFAHIGGFVAGVLSVQAYRRRGARRLTQGTPRRYHY